MYYKTIEKDGGVYSIDRFTFDFALFQRIDDLVKTFDNLVEEYRCRMAVQNFITKRFGYDKYIYQFDHAHFELWEKTVYLNLGTHVKKIMVDAGKKTILRVDFNPNKSVDNLPLQRFFAFISTAEDFSWCVSRVDYAFDIRGALNEFYCLTRKTESNLLSTRYYGIRGNSGYLRIYDKRKEIKDKDHLDLGYELTRFEWEQRGNNDMDFTFDKISRFNLADLRGAAVLRFVPPELINAALASYDPRTAVKIRKKCFDPLPFDPYNFRILLRDFFEEYNLPVDRRRDFKQDWANGDDFFL